MKHTGNLTITDQNLKTCLVLAQVTGALYVRAEGAQFPALVKTCALYVLAKGAQFPELVKTGTLDVWAEGAQFPKLAEVTGALDVWAKGAQFPKLVKTGALDVQAEGAQFPKLAEVTGALDVLAEGAQFPKLGRVIAMSTWGLVLLNNGMFCAGCRDPWTREQALEHWGQRTDERAKLFTAAIKQLGEDA